MEKNKQQLIVPNGIRYVSQWSDYSLRNFEFPHILDKKIPGCGFTEYCITCNIPIVLCSPRRMLLENKEGQHVDDVFYFRNEEFDSVDTSKDLTRVHKGDSNVNVDEINRDRVMYLYQSLGEYILHRQFKNVPPKILVTYDSFRLVRDYLENHGLFNQFHIVVDEWQSIFVDSRFKSSSEIEFLNYLQGIEKLCFVSATPMIEDYLKMMPEFKDLPYYEFDWETEDPLRVSSPDLKVRVARSVQSSAKMIIDEYKTGVFENYSYTDKSGNLQTISSVEAVFFVNSVVNIVSIIKGSELLPSEVNVLCARTPENEKKIREALNEVIKIKNIPIKEKNDQIKKKNNEIREHNRSSSDKKSLIPEMPEIPRISSKASVIGSIPLKGEPHKMFTLCTRTVYLGADFYSTCARTFIFSDANVDSLAVDISLDLPQILGRQRLNENPWKNRAELYYKTSRTEKSREEFDAIIEAKRKQTLELLDIYNNISDESKKEALINKFSKDLTNYKSDYLSINRHAGSNSIPVFNNLVLISEKRAFDIQQIDYKDRFSVFNTLLNNSMISSDSGSKVVNFLLEFNVLPSFYEKMKYLCEEELTDNERYIILDQIPLTYKTYYNSLGTVRLKANGYNITKIQKEFSMLGINKEDLANSIYLSFEVGCRYTNSYIKETLRGIYESLEYKKTPKATDLEEYFNLKVCKIVNGAAKDNGFEILKKIKD